MAALTPERWRALSPYVDRALDLTGDERTTWLADLRREHPEIAADLEALLFENEALSRAGFLAGVAAPVQPDLSRAGYRLGAYTLLSPIGRGGMGTVWLAERSDGRFTGKAAVKLLNLALIGRAGEERFRREGNILARLTHAHIAHLIDAGVTDTGQPFLVIEHVDGAQIDEYLRSSFARHRSPCAIVPRRARCGGARPCQPDRPP